MPPPVAAIQLMTMMHLFIDVLIVDQLGLKNTRIDIFDDGWHELWKAIVGDDISDDDATALMHRDDIRAGFYDAMNALQGRYGTYYVGSVMNMETVEHTAQFSTDLVDHHF